MEATFHGKDIELATDFTYQQLHCPFCGEKMYMFMYKDKPTFVSAGVGGRFYYCTECNELFIVGNAYFTLKKIYNRGEWGFILKEL